MFPEKTKQTCNALIVHSQKSCTGGAFEPVIDMGGWGGLLFICFDGAI